MAQRGLLSLHPAFLDINISHQRTFIKTEECAWYYELQTTFEFPQLRKSWLKTQPLKK